LSYLSWHVGRRVSPGVKRYTTVATREVPHLRLPTPLITTEFVDEYDRRTLARVFDMQAHVIICDGELSHVWQALLAVI
jgi:hypothetical protein